MHSKSYFIPSLSSILFISLLATGLFSLEGEAAAPESKACPALLKKGLSGKEKKSLADAKKAKCSLTKDIIHWIYLQKPDKSQTFKEITHFILAHPHWPHLRRLRHRAEETLSPNERAPDVLKFFNTLAPLTGRGGLFYTQALLCQDHAARARVVAQQCWAQLIFTPQDEATFLKRYHTYLEPKHHKIRLDWLLWMNHLESSQRMLNRVPLSYRFLCQARLALKKGKGISQALSQVPPSLAKDPALIYDKLAWHMGQKQEKEALALLRTHPIPHPLPYPTLWWKQKYLLIRMLIRDKRYGEAYALALNHQLTKGPELSEAEWVSGWLALRFLQKPLQAKAHFINMYHHVETPISKAKGAYWVGRACEVLGLAKEAAEWYGRSAQFPTTFYGQLSQQQIKVDSFSWQKTPQGIPSHHEDLLQAASLFQKAGASRESLVFLKHFAAYAHKAQEQQQLIHVAHKISGPFSGHVVEIAKKANRSHEVRLKEAYPLIPVPASVHMDPALILAIIRQESCFSKGAKSSANALGMMQLVPRTAQEIAKKVGTRFHLASLTQNPHYNIKLGVSHFERILKAYEGSVILAIAAYNAGIGNVRKWIKDYGNPQDPTIDPIDWMESIPFGETRSYLHRVLEGAVVYRKRLTEGKS
jgi:soluble lytic murein transglycosylase